MKMFRNSSRTLRSGCNAPPLVGIPSASKLYFLNLASFQLPLDEMALEYHEWRARCTNDCNISTVKSVSSLSSNVLKLGPF